MGSSIEIGDGIVEFTLRSGEKVSVSISADDGLGVCAGSVKIIAHSVGSRMLVIPDSNNSVRITTVKAHALVEQEIARRVIERKAKEGRKSG